jgi:hypothetical protein
MTASGVAFLGSLGQDESRISRVYLETTRLSGINYN